MLGKPQTVGKAIVKKEFVACSKIDEGKGKKTSGDDDDSRSLLIALRRQNCLKLPGKRNHPLTFRPSAALEWARIAAKLDMDASEESTAKTGILPFVVADVKCPQDSTADNNCGKEERKGWRRKMRR